MANFQQFIQRIAEKIPGYAGYQALEQRRDADKTLRMNLARQYRQEQHDLTRLAQNIVTRGHIEYSARLERINQVLNGFIARLETAPYGYAGWFSAAQIGEPDLEQIYQLDASLADGIRSLHERIQWAEGLLVSGASLDEALDTLLNLMDELHTRLEARQAFLVIGKQPTAPARSGSA